MSFNVEIYKTMKEESDKHGFEIQMSMGEFKKNHNKIVVKHNLTPQQFITESMAAHDIIRRGDNIIQNVWFRNPANELVLAPMLWVEKLKIVKTDRVYSRNGNAKFPFPTESVTIPKEVEELYSRKESYLFFNL